MQKTTSIRVWFLFIFILSFPGRETYNMVRATYVDVI